MLCQELQYNEELDTIYRKRLLLETDGKIAPASVIEFPRPPLRILREYEKMKTDFTDQVLSQGRKEIELAELRMKKRNEGVLEALKQAKEKEYASEVS